jgi:PAS domain-containing protein
MESKRAESTRHPDDLELSVIVGPGYAYEWSNLLLAKARFSGRLELLTSAWEKMLGYACHEFAGKTLRQIMGLEPPVRIAAVAAILDEQNPAPVDLKVFCRNGQIKSLRLHRRFAPDEDAVYILAEETADPINP